MRRTRWAPRKTLAPPNYSPKPWLPPRPKKSTATPTKLLTRIKKTGARVQLLKIGEVGKKGNLTGPQANVGFWYMQACEIHTDQIERDDAVMHLLREAEYLEWLQGTKRLEAQPYVLETEDSCLQNDRLANYHMALKWQHEHKMAERKAAKMFEIANSVAAMRARVDRIEELRASTAVDRPARMTRNPLGHTIHMPRE